MMMHVQDAAGGRALGGEDDDDEYDDEPPAVPHHQPCHHVVIVSRAELHVIMLSSLLFVLLSHASPSSPSYRTVCTRMYMSAGLDNISAVSPHVSASLERERQQLEAAYIFGNPDRPASTGGGTHRSSTGLYGWKEGRNEECVVLF